MGVSFLRQEDVARMRESANREAGSRRPTRIPADAAFDSLYHPAMIRVPADFSGLSSTPSIGTEESLDRNSMALKYLDDDMLSRVASGAARRPDPASSSAAAAAGVSQFGLGEGNLSVATRQFFEKNLLGVDEDDDDKEGRPGGLVGNLVGFPKFQ